MSSKGRSRRRSQRRQARSKEDRQAFSLELDSMVAKIPGGLEPGMERKQALDLIHEGAITIAVRMTHEDGLVTRSPWGLYYDQATLLQTIKAGLTMLGSGNAELHDERDVDEATAQRAMLETVSGCVTMAAAAILYLESLPVPYEMARHLLASILDEDGNRSD